MELYREIMNSSIQRARLLCKGLEYEFAYFLPLENLHFLDISLVVSESINILNGSVI